MEDLIKQIEENADKMVDLAMKNGCGGHGYSYHVLSNYPRHVIYHNEGLDDFGISEIDLENRVIRDIYYTKNATEDLKVVTNNRKPWYEYLASTLFSRLMLIIDTEECEERDLII